MEVPPIMHRCFYVALDPSKEFAEIPEIWSDGYGHRLTKTALLTDAHKNKFHILVSSYGNKLFFTKGVLDLLRHYNLREGGWMRVFYLGGSEFNVQMMDRQLDIKKDYHKLPATHEFGWESSGRMEDGYDSGPESEANGIIQYFEQEISASHIKYNKKALPIALVRNAILPRKPKFCVIRDNRRQRFYCEYSWSRRNVDDCCLTIGWLDFVQANGLTAGSKIGFYINKIDPTVVHVHVFH